MQTGIALVNFGVFLGILIAAFLNYERPYNILAESWRQTLALVSNHRKWCVIAFAIYALKVLFEFGVALAPLNVLEKIIASIAVQAVAIFVLAHLALRLHRGLILNEWPWPLHSGSRERRMALYVLGCWAVISLLSHLPIPVPPLISPTGTELLKFGIRLVVLAAKATLILCGPAASLDDPQPLRRAFESLKRAPIAILSILLIFEFFGGVAAQTFGLANHILQNQGAIGLVVLPFVVLVQVILFAVTEFSLVIMLTRIWEDHYEPQTRYALHNINWI